MYVDSTLFFINTYSNNNYSYFLLSPKMWEVFAQSPEPEAHVKKDLLKGVYVWVSTPHIV